MYRAQRQNPQIIRRLSANDHKNSESNGILKIGEYTGKLKS